VTFVGAVPHDDVSAYFHLCDLFVLPSLYEGLPLALLEAMACGRPAIFSDLDPARRVFRSGQDVMLVPPGDERVLARAIAALMADAGLRVSLGEAARIRARAFTADLEVESLERTYAQVLARRANGSGSGGSC
jgi:glycosyltransferase involved in cell wall biosynthesis